MRGWRTYSYYLGKMGSLGVYCTRAAPTSSLWKINMGGSTLNEELLWEWEPNPSSREDDYLKRNRMTLDDAKARWQAYCDQFPTQEAYREHWKNLPTAR